VVKVHNVDFALYIYRVAQKVSGQVFVITGSNIDGFQKKTIH